MGARARASARPKEGGILATVGTADDHGDYDRTAWQL